VISPPMKDSSSCDGAASPHHQPGRSGLRDRRPCSVLAINKIWDRVAACATVVRMPTCGELLIAACLICRLILTY
jgi:hypothetical protein